MKIPKTTKFHSKLHIFGKNVFIHLQSVIAYYQRGNLSIGENELQRLKFTSAVGKSRGFCRGISPFYSICFGN